MFVQIKFIDKKQKKKSVRKAMFSVIIFAKFLLYSRQIFLIKNRPLSLPNNVSNFDINDSCR